MTTLRFYEARDAEWGDCIIVTAEGPCGKDVGPVGYIVEPDGPNPMVVIPKPLGHLSAAVIASTARVMEPTIALMRVMGPLRVVVTQGGEA